MNFIPKPFSAPLLLLMFDARLAKALRRYWIWLPRHPCVQGEYGPAPYRLLCRYWVYFDSRPRDWAELKRWHVWPLVVALAWLLLCVCWITPALNHGNVDYGMLYGRLGDTTGEILRNFIVRPQLAAGALGQSLLHGNLVWALLLPFRWFAFASTPLALVACPILLQHLLSLATIGMDYLFPLRRAVVAAFLDGCGRSARRPDVADTFFRSNAGALFRHRDARRLRCRYAGFPWAGARDVWRAREAILPNAPSVTERIPSSRNKSRPGASVVAPLSYLSHLAMREHLYSLHFILKGLRTLSHAPYEPPAPTDFRFGRSNRLGHGRRGRGVLPSSDSEPPMAW